MGLGPGYKRTEVGLIPEDWQVKALEELAHIQRGASPRPISSPIWYDVDSEVGWVRISDIPDSEAKYLTETQDYFSDKGIARSRYLPSGSLIMSICATVGVPAITRLDACIHDGFVGITDLQQVDQDFLYYKLRELQSTFRTIGQTGSQNNLNSTLVREQLVAVPPLPEQHAIAEVLNDVDALIAALDRLIAKKRAIKQGAMQQLLTGTTRLPGFSEPWEVKRVGEAFRLLRTASNSRSDLSPDGDVKYIHYGDVHTKWRCYLDCEKDDIPLIHERHLPKVPFLEDGDLVMVDASEDYEGIGASVEVKNATGRRVVAGLHTLVLRGDKDLLANGFKAYIQYIPSFKEELIEIATGTSVYGVSKSRIQQVPIPLPPLPEQRAIAAVLSDMDAEIASLEARRDKTRAVKQGMMQELLTGRIRLV